MLQTKPKVLFTDGEGPLVFKDLARDAAASKISEGSTIFDTLSLCVAYASELDKSYQPGETLAFLVAHLLAHEITDEDLRLESHNAQLANGVEAYLLSLARENWEVRVISTAYAHLWETVGPRIGISPHQFAATPLSLDEIKKKRWKPLMTEAVLKVENEILSKSAQLEQAFKSIRDGMSLSEAFSRSPLNGVQSELFHLHRIVLPGMDFDPLEVTKVIGGERKTHALLEFAKDLNVEPQDIVYVGDSITDDRTHRFVKENGGLSIAVNGDEFAIRNAVVAIASEDMQELKSLLDSWVEGGHQEVRNHVMESNGTSFGRERLASPEISGKHLAIVTEDNVLELVGIHREYRNRIRGKSAPLI